MLKKWLITCACIEISVVLKNEPIRKEVAHEHEHGALYVHVDAIRIGLRVLRVKVRDPSTIHQLFFGRV